MFFPEKIVSIKQGDKVLEIGPGATPHERSDVFLEKTFDTEEELIAQSGHVGKLETDKPVIYYKGDTFPFKDNEFDYIICSHVLEHVDDIDCFLKEITRVGKSGYLEFPTIYYDYLHNIEEHQNMLLIEDNNILWCKKTETPLPQLNNFTDFFRALQLNNYRFQKEINALWHHGMEWQSTIKHTQVSDWKDLTYSKEKLGEIIKPVQLSPNTPQQSGVKMAVRQLLSAIKSKLSLKK